MNGTVYSSIYGLLAALTLKQMSLEMIVPMRMGHLCATTN
jgi:hypothetical protein